MSKLFLTLLVAMISGTPVVATAESVVRELQRELHRKNHEWDCQLKLIAGTGALSVELREALTQAKDVANELQKSFPQEENVIIGIGKSPSLVIAALQSQTHNYAFNLPLSAFRPLIQGPRGFPVNIETSQMESLAQEDEERLYQHLTKYLPHDSRRLVILDFASTGATLTGVYHYLKQHQYKADIRSAVHVYALVTAESSLTATSYLDKSLTKLGYFSHEKHFSSYKLKPEISRLVSDQDSDFSEFGSYLLKEDELIEPEGLYFSLVRLFQEWEF